MKTEVQPRDDQQVNLTVELDADEVQKYLVRAAKDISKNTRIPGFRPGKAPYDVVKRNFGDKQIEEKATEIILDEIYPQALKQENIDPSGAGNIAEMPTLYPAVFKFVVPLQPEVTLCDYRSIRHEYTMPDVTDENVNHVLQHLQFDHATSEPITDRPAQDMDRVYLTLNGKMLSGDDTEELVKNQSLQIIISDDSDEKENVWPYPEFYKELVGMKIDEEKTVKYTYPEDSLYERLRGKEVEFSFQVQGINALTLPDLNDEFAQTIGAEFETIDALKKVIHAQLTESTRAEYEEKYIDTYISEIVSQSNVKYPPHMLEEEVKHAQQNFEQNLSRQRMDLDTYLKTIKTDKETFIATDIKPAAEKELVRSLVLQKLLNEEDIKFSQMELQTAVNSTIQRLSYQSSMPKLPKGMTTKDFIQATTMQTASQLLNDRLMKRLKDIASGEIDKPVITEPAAVEESSEGQTEVTNEEKNSDSAE